MIDKDEKPLVSVILPVYNTEEYLKESLDALTNQTLENIEIICINDASTDNCLEILQDYASKDKRFTIINNETNSGPSICRNIALDHVTGEYITFYDSDDKIDLDAYERLYNFAKKYDQDFVICNAVRLEDEEVIKPSILHLHSIPDKCVPKTNILEHQEFVYDTTLWNKFIKHDFLKAHQFKFAEGRVYQDILFTMQMFCASDCVGIIPEVVYYWRRRGNENESITQRPYKTKNLHDRMFILKKTLEVIKSDEKHLDILDMFYFKLVEIDLIKFLNQLDWADDEFKQIMFGKVKSYVESLPKKYFEILEQRDMVKVELYLNGFHDSLIEVVKTQRTNRLTKKELKTTIKELKKETKQLKSENKTLKEDNENLKEKNERLQTDLDYLKSVSGWSKYKLKNIF